MGTIKDVFVKYCANYHDAVELLAQYTADAEKHEFILQCHRKRTKNTNRWDLGSFLIMPIQRVLKFPLLLKVSLSLQQPICC